MKIFREGSYLNQISSITRANAHPSAEASTKTNSKNFDAILIRSRETPDDATFAKDIAKRISREVRSESNPQKLEDCRAQVQSGNYQIMIDEIAKKLLLS